MLCAVIELELNAKSNPAAHWTLETLKATVLNYRNVVRQEKDNALTAEEFTQLAHRETLCRDILLTIIERELSQSADVQPEVEDVVDEGDFFLEDGNFVDDHFWPVDLPEFNVGDENLLDHNVDRDDLVSVITETSEGGSVSDASS
ncbi:hypothetical protein QBC32DRAFT_326725 [Pseudoneurospora amorphoporcata]|uniref:Uncharacterized protein n=1 Tax=Pseudoneurospora amorphoporcata TaxID=241081 RepID=A0AAN6NQ37_9PEZI|nr:hypothetical protein QBC32DRAFT_326725 [Pseudoneurospora amorphoporcata]